MSDLAAILGALGNFERKRETNRLDHYAPYEYQRKFHGAIGHKTQKLADVRALVAANKIGKTYTAAMEVAMHLTGRYPADWNGHRFSMPTFGMAAGSTNDTTRDIIQHELFGDPTDDSKLGTGTVPLSCIGKVVRKAGVPNAFDNVLVKHTTGKFSKIVFKAYEQGFKKFMGKHYDFQWCDEEPPQDVWSQIGRGTLAKNKSIVMATLTPEEGMTAVVSRFFNELPLGQALITATWDDAPHMTLARRQEQLAKFPESEHELRMLGKPIGAAGMVWPVPESQLRCDPLEIPNHWARICAIDFGWDHPFAAVWIAWDRDTDTAYVYDCYREAKALPSTHAAAINSRGDWIPVVWPHDGLNTEKGSGTPLAQIYRDLKVNMLYEKFSNPPQDGVEEGKGGNSVEMGIMDIHQRMKESRVKVFSTLAKWWEEFRMYHRKDGKIVALHEDLMSATRYAAMSLRHAQTKSSFIPKQVVPLGVSNWG